MISLLFLFAVLLAAGLFLILADALKLPTLGAAKAMLSAGRQDKKTAKTIEACMQRAYHCMKNDTLMDNGYVRHLMKFKNPLLVVHEQLMAEDFSIEAEFAAKLDATLYTMKDHDDFDEDYELDGAFLDPEQDEGVQMC